MEHKWEEVEEKINEIKKILMSHDIVLNIIHHDDYSPCSVTFEYKGKMILEDCYGIDIIMKNGE